MDGWDGMGYLRWLGTLEHLAVLINCMIFHERATHNTKRQGKHTMDTKGNETIKFVPTHIIPLVKIYLQLF